MSEQILRLRIDQQRERILKAVRRANLFAHLCLGFCALSMIALGVVYSQTHKPEEPKTMGYVNFNNVDDALEYLSVNEYAPKGGRNYQNAHGQQAVLWIDNTAPTGVQIELKANGIKVEGWVE